MPDDKTTTPPAPLPAPLPDPDPEIIVEVEPLEVADATHTPGPTFRNRHMVRAAAVREWIATGRGKTA